MKIEITIKSGVMVASRVGPSVSIEEFATALADALPELLRDVYKKSPRDAKVADVTVELYRFPDENHPDIWIKVTDFDPVIHEVPVMPYDKVWRILMEWCAATRWMFPAACFQYDTGTHGMTNAGGKYESW